MNDLKEVPIVFFILLAIILLAQSIYLFIDARKRGHARWFWGLWGMIQTPMPIVVYLLWSRVVTPAIQRRREKNGEC
ncbi:sigmaY antisigma factor component [Jeotgalibacillus sp. ET6]|uniref:sigmaY antisigma factor component n=1 Tax=Jeotgalibacillus sp. ET6 TaxID=3037260 RepID=UPI00241882BD|nr:sigmaY antisigma factor component [Jeotgalibacillus sp. ET6]MDG5473856.1 sigmaY antisigma factor component [Jeotgalibacillus sp. ET6]